MCRLGERSLQSYCSMDFDFLASMRFDMTFDVTLQIRVTKNVSFSLLLVTSRMLVEIHLLKVSCIS